MSSTYGTEWIQARDSGPRTLYERRDRAPARAATRVAFLAGFLVAWTQLLAPIHEMGHVLVGWLDPAITIEYVEWATTYYTGNATPPFLVAGFAFVTAVYTTAAVLLAKRKRLVAASFFAGNILTQPIYAARSTDIYALQLEFGDTARSISMIFLWVITVWGLLLALAHIQHVRDLSGSERKLAQKVSMIPDPPGRKV